MALSQPDTRALQAYNKWRSEALVECKDITSDSHALLDAFIPKSQVEHFFEDEYRLKQLLLRHVRYEKCETVCRSIRRSYSRVYCILLDIRRPQLIEQFTEHHELRDEMLPFSKRPSPFPNTSNDPEVWSDFYKKQRVYCPITLEDEEWMQHPAEQVLPFTSMKRLKVTGSTADLYCAEIHKEYDGLESHEQVCINSPTSTRCVRIKLTFSRLHRATSTGKSPSKSTGALVICARSLTPSKKQKISA